MVFALVICSGCLRSPRLQTWRLITQDSTHILIPPDVKSPDLSQRSLAVKAKIAGRACPVNGDVLAVKMRRGLVRVTVSRDVLAKQSQGWLASWAAQLESRDCLGPGEGMKLATRVAEAVPLDMNMAVRLLHPDDWRTGRVDLGPQTRLRVLSPIWLERGVGMMTGPASVTGTDQHLIVTGQSTENLAGYERTFYAIAPRAGGLGFEITIVSSDRYATGAAVEHRQRPAVDLLKLPTEAAYFRLFYESWQNGFSALVVGARTPDEMERRTAILDAAGESASCGSLNNELCVAVPKEVAVTPMIAVTVDEKEIMVASPATVESAIVTSGVKSPRSVLPRLVVSKLWNRRLAAVVFDPADGAILRLNLGGGEVISWR